MNDMPASSSSSITIPRSQTPLSRGLKSEAVLVMRMSSIRAGSSDTFLSAFLTEVYSEPVRSTDISVSVDRFTGF